MKIKTCNRLIAPDTLFCFEKLKSLSRLFSRLFDLSEKDGETRFRYLVGCCLEGTSISDYCEDHKAVSADTVLKLGHLPLSGMVEKCNRLLGFASGIGLRTGRYRDCDSSIDYHDVPYHGLRREHTIKVLINGKYRRCYRYAVAALTGPRLFMCTGIQLYREGVSNVLMVDRLLDTLPANILVNMDRYFCGVDVFNRTEEKQMHYLTPYKINSKTDQLYLESLLDGKKVKPYTMRKRGRTQYKTVNMYLEPNSEDEYHAYVSDLPDLKINDHYPYRWNIENLFKILKLLKPMTSTTNEAFRILLMTISLILASLWKLLVTLKQYYTVKQYKEQLIVTLQTINPNKTTPNNTIKR